MNVNNTERMLCYGVFITHLQYLCTISINDDIDILVRLK